MEVQISQISDKYASLGAGSSFLGAPVTPETPTPNGAGAFQHYQNGSIYWSGGTGAHEVHGAILGKWQETGSEQGFAGFPLTDELETPNGLGRYNHFEGASIYWTPATGAHEVHGAIRHKWTDMGWEQSVIGFPLTDEQGSPDGLGRFNHFEWGSIYWSPASGAHEVHGFIRARWAVLGLETGQFGYPTSDEHPTMHGFGRMSEFERGTIYWDEARGPYEVFPDPNPEAFAPNPGVLGSWEIPSFTSGVVGVHSAVLHTNDVAFFSYRDPGEHAAEEPQPHGDAALLNLATGNVTLPALAPGEMNLFCAGQCFLADGRLLVVGGERFFPGIRALHTFSPGGPGGGSWQYLRDMNVGRWYATPVTLPDGRVLIAGGVNMATPENTPANVTYEVFDPATNNVSPLNVLPGLVEAGPFVTFPFSFVLPNHRLLLHAGARTRFLNLDTMTDEANFFDACDRPDRNCRTYNLQGTSVLLPLLPDSSPPYRARVMAIGGGGAVGADIRMPATSSCEMIDLDAAAPAWEATPPMANQRVMPDAVLLPDGKVFVSNGSSTGIADNAANPVYQAETYDPDTNTWQQMAYMQVPRLYHSGALLLPDGRVMTCGSDSMWNPDPFHEAQLRLEIFSPPYLFAGARPGITNAPAEVGYGGTFTIDTPDAADIDKVSFVRCGSTTHSFNSDQRLVGLAIVGLSPNSLNLEAPPDGFVAPPGYYMLFILRNGVPSESRFVRLGLAPRSEKLRAR